VGPARTSTVRWRLSHFLRSARSFDDRSRAWFHDLNPLAAARGLRAFLEHKALPCGAARGASLDRGRAHTPHVEIEGVRTEDDVHAVRAQVDAAGPHQMARHEGRRAVECGAGAAANSRLSAPTTSASSAADGADGVAGTNRSRGVAALRARRRPLVSSAASAGGRSARPDAARHRATRAARRVAQRAQRQARRTP